MTIILDPARILFCTHFSGVHGIQLVITQAMIKGVPVGPDPSQATAASIDHSPDNGVTVIPWAVTLTADTIAKTLTIRHAFVTGDLVAADLGTAMRLDPSITIGGITYACVSRTLPIIA
jgi:hypothetical protein